MSSVTARPESSADVSVPLFVDLDGTLVRTDLLLESVLALLRSSFHMVFMLPVWLLRGKAHFKRKVAEHTHLDPGDLPYHEEFLSFLVDEHSRGRELILASAADARIVEAVASHLRIFSQHFGSDGKNNLSGRRKLAAIKRLIGDSSFDYAANGRVDIAVWKAARRAIVVNASSALMRDLERFIEIDRTFHGSKERFAAFLRAIRCHQWLKNLLVFAPAVMAHRLMDPTVMGHGVLAFLSFSFAASAAYLANDLLDLESDRRHATKRHRPFASGDLPLTVGLIGVPGLLGAAALIASVLPPQFALVLGVYVVVTMAYSTVLKRTIVMDVLTLAGLYTLRIIAGGAAVQIELSSWLMGFSLFLFLSLAIVKRYSELMRIDAGGGTKSFGRGYRVGDLAVLGQLGTASGMMAVLVLALYIDSENVTELYSRPQAIWLICPVMLYWICRMWLLTTRGKVDEDPIVFAARDRRTYILGLVSVLILWFAT